MAASRSEAEADSRCMLVPVAGTRLESACLPANQAGTCHVTCNGASMKLLCFVAPPRCEAEVDSRCMLVPAANTRLESACRCACSSLPPALGLRVLAALPTRQAPASVICNGPYVKPRLMEQALRLLHCARRRRTQGACSSLPGWRVLAALSTRQPPTLM